MVKVFIGELLPNVLPFHILNRHLGKEPYKGKKAYRAVFDEMDFSFLQIVNDPYAADFFLLPHNYFSIKTYPAYLDNFLAHARRRGKKTIIFAYGDSDEPIEIPDAYLFRYSGYRYRGLKRGEIIMPTQIYAGDILNTPLFSLREKKDIPTVSFCGWAGFSTLRQWAGYALRTFLALFKKYILRDSHAELFIKAVYFRRKALRALSSASSIKTSFVTRNFYTPNKNTVQGDPAVLRREYIENIQNSDFVLVARGDANMAVRFYETLALGRIPLLIDTDWVLPLEDEIDYKKFVVFVPHADIQNIGSHIKAFWDRLNDEEYKKIQIHAREIFMKYLKFDVFVRHVCEDKLKP